MKVVFDTNVYAAEALLGQVAEQLLEATVRASWRIFASPYLLAELERVLTDKLGFSRRLAQLSRRRIIHRAELIEPGASRHVVPQDPADSPILRAALTAGAGLSGHERRSSSRPRSLRGASHRLDGRLFPVAPG